MTRRIAGASPRLKARIAGLLYLLIFIAAPSGAATAMPAKMIIKEVAGYALVIATGGAKVAPGNTKGERSSGYIMPNELSGTNIDTGALASMLASPAGRPVQDQTGLQGK